MEENLIFLDINKFDELLSKYFKTLEQQELENQLINEEQEKVLKELEEDNLIKQQELETRELTSLEFQQTLLNEIKVLQYNTQLINNIGFWAIVVGGVILCSTLFYKFLKIFV